MANLANKVKATIKVADPVPQPPDTVILEMPKDIAQGLMTILSKVSTASKLGGISFEVYMGLSDAGIKPKLVHVNVHPGLNIVEFAY